MANYFPEPSKEEREELARQTSAWAAAMDARAKLVARADANAKKRSEVDLMLAEVRAKAKADMDAVAKKQMLTNMSNALNVSHPLEAHIRMPMWLLEQIYMQASSHRAELDPDSFRVSSNGSGLKVSAKGVISGTNKVVTVGYSTTHTDIERRERMNPNENMTWNEYQAYKRVTQRVADSVTKVKDKAQTEVDMIRQQYMAPVFVNWYAT